MPQLFFADAEMEFNPFLCFISHIAQVYLLQVKFHIYFNSLRRQSTRAQVKQNAHKIWKTLLWHRQLLKKLQMGKKATCCHGGQRKTCI